MTNSHHLLILNPPPTPEDREHIRSIMHFPVQTTDGRQFTISLLGQSHTVNCICISIPISDRDFSGADLKRISRINSRMLATLRMSYDPSTDVVPMEDGFLNAVYNSEEDFPTRLPIYLAMQVDPAFRINIDNLERVFKQGNQVPGLFEMIGEVNLPSLPIQYKFLASYKVLDIASQGVKGFSSTVRDVIDRKNPQFRGLEVSQRTFRNFIHEYRNKCAHIYTGGDLVLGIAGLASAETEIVRKIMPLMRETMFEAVHTCFPHLGVTFQARRP